MIEEPKAYFTLNYTTLVWTTFESHPAIGLRSVRYALKQEKQVSIKHMFQENEFAPCKERGQNILYIYMFICIYKRTLVSAVMNLRVP